MNCPHCGEESCDLGWQCPKSKVTPREVFGDGAFLADTAVLRRPHLVTIGKRTNIDHGVYITTAARIGDYCHIAPYCTIIGGARGVFEMGHFATLGAGSRIVCGNDAADDGLTGPTIPAEAHATVTHAPVVFEPMAIGTTGIIVLPGVRVGMGAIIGAGAVVTKDVWPWTVVAGVPARAVRDRPREKILEAARRLGYDFGKGGA